MTIQLMSSDNMVRIGDKFFPAIPFPGNAEHAKYGVGIGYEIPLGESGRKLSIAIGAGTYNEHYNLPPCFIDPYSEMEMVEVGFSFDKPRYDWSDETFDVTGYVDDDSLLRMISEAMKGNDPF
jgi:hypothetical protein